MKKTNINHLNNNESGWDRDSLWSKNTGLPVIIWVFAKCNKTHSPRIEVGDNPNKWNNNTFFLTISDDPQVIGKCELNETDMNKIKHYVIKNKHVLLDHWNMKISSAGLIEGLGK